MDIQILTDFFPNPPLQGNGGAIWQGPESRLTITECAFSQNEGYGYCPQPNTNSPEVDDTLCGGGAIFNVGGVLDMAKNTLQDNYSGKQV